MTMEYLNDPKDYQNQTELMITLNLYNERYFMTEWKEIFEESKKKKLQEINISQVMSRKPLYSEPSRKSRVIRLNRDISFVLLTTETPEGYRTGITGISKNWKPTKITKKKKLFPIVDHQQEIKKHMEIETQKVKRIFNPNYTQENKKQNHYLHSQSSYRPQRYEIRKNHF